LHIAITIALIVVLTRPSIDYYSTAFLFLFFAFYVVRSLKEFRQSKKMKKHRPELHVEDIVEKVTCKEFIDLVIGFFFLYYAGKVLVEAGTTLGPMLGISEYVISAAFVAFGTSFPELVTSIVACLRKKNVDIITGNILGSNFFNIALVLGSIGFYNVNIHGNYYLEFSLLIGAAVLIWPKSNFKVHFFRFSGGPFLACYCFIVYYWANSEKLGQSWPALSGHTI